MKPDKNYKGSSFLKRRANYGYLFILPWIIGFLLFFLEPFVKTVLFSFFKIDDRLQLVSFEGLNNFKQAFSSDPHFIRNLTGVITAVIVDTPMIVIFSLFAATLIHKDFPGRFIARLIFFLPIIYGTGFLIQMNAQYTTTAAYDRTSGELMNFFSEVAELFPGAEVILGFVERLFDIITRSGVQILIYLAGINSIPVSYYEASKIDGAHEWSTFWLITFPVISPFILMNTVYTIVDSFTLSNNPIIETVYDSIRKMQFSYGSTRAVIYFTCIFVIVTVVTWLISKKVRNTVGE